MGVAATYAGRVFRGVASWRRKPTLVGALALVALGLLGLHYGAGAGSGPPPQQQQQQQPPPAQAAAAPPPQHTQPPPPAPRPRSLAQVAPPADVGAGSVRFVQGSRAAAASVSEPPPPPPPQLLQRLRDVEIITSPALVREQPSRDEIAARRLASESAAQIGSLAGRPAAVASTASPVFSGAGQAAPLSSADQQQQLYQLGVPIVNIDPQHPYVPPHRLLHLDFKGAPPKVSFLKLLLPLARQLGATGVLLEWEDMFPWEGALRPLAAANCYSPQEVQALLRAAEASQLEVIPLVQTFGHVEFALKHREFEGLREVPESAQALCPSLNASLDFVEKLIDQVMKAHQGARYLHIGCDEVFQMGECPRCRTQMRDALFLTHVARVAGLVRSKYPSVTPIIWDDMLRHLSPQSLDEARIGDLVEPMVWVYAEDVYRFVPVMVWDKYAAVFPRVWAASAFKGAFGETLYIPNVKRHLENNLRWLEVMSAEAPKFRGGFSGIAITGWQRYDHYSVLCELLPAAVPSLAVNLLATSRGFFNQSLRHDLQSNLGCARAPVGSQHDYVVNLNSDPFLWEKFGRCFFPGAPFFKLTYRLHAAEIEAKELLESVRHNKGWMTDYNVRHNFSTPLRVDELMAEQPRVYHTVLSLVRSAQDSLQDVFDGYTITEWVEQRLYPLVRDLERLQQDAVALKAARTWPARPLPPLQDLRRLGIPLPGDPPRPPPQ
ncbi:hexosaminidase D-like [Schistocerca cancellata]|uniref:hexosaminidase D-like n=1 Tax=Schistocerca cancellata TaxID=274614 RepID=UPI0021180297|nr:hexosaminidase D-like [Schistocerca cancellata]